MFKTRIYNSKRKKSLTKIKNANFCFRVKKFQKRNEKKLFLPPKLYRQSCCVIQYFGCA